MLFAKIIVWLTVPLVIAAILARLVRLPQYTRRIALVMYVAILSGVALYPWSSAMRLGIDLSGGTILVYQVQKPLPADFSIDKMIVALNRRINPAGVLDTSIRGIGNDRVEIIIPRAAPQEVERCKRILTSVGSLEFRILANKRDSPSLIARGEQTFPGPVMSKEGKTLARWVPLADKSDLNQGGDIALRVDPNTGIRYVLVVHDPFNVTGEYLTRAEQTTDDRGRLAVGFHFNAKGSTLFGTLTGKNLPENGFERRLAVILNGEVYSAPGIQDQITSNGIIRGDFTREQVTDLVAVLNAGSLPGELVKTPASELTIGPTLGRDTIHSGLMAMAIATSLVLVFMAVYYHLAGLIADVAVMLNVLIVVGVMAWLHATWTLAGLAGLALTVGMAVDANVLIYERLREEQARGRSLRMTIEYAFDRALSPILDSNITTLLAGCVLYAVGSEQVKGFAVTLIIGLIANLFTAVFVCRLLFDIIERNAWVSRISMLSIFGKPNFDFVGKRRYFVGASILLIGVGLSTLFLRGSNMLDIDFTGGTLAAVHFTEQTSSATVRTLASQALNDDAVSVEELQLHNEPRGHRFLIRTTIQDPDEVKKDIAKAMGSQLASTTMTHTAIEPIPKATEAVKPADAAKPADAGKPADAAKAEDASKTSDASKAKDPAKTADATKAEEAAKPKAADEKAADDEPETVASETFAGGTRTDLEFNSPVLIGGLQSIIEAALTAEKIPDPARRFSIVGVGKPTVQATGGENDQAAENEWSKVALRTDLDAATLKKVLPLVAQRIGDQSMFERLDNFGSQVAQEMQTAAVIAVALSMLVIVGYLWIRFQNISYGVGAVVAILHDVSVVVGLLAVSGWLAGTFIGHALMIEDFKINLPVVAALLTLVGFSVNDTIVVFDRIREVKGKRREVTWDVINESVNQTLSRTILTSLTVWLVAVILYVVGGVAIHGLAFCLLAGVIVGTYSSIYIASPFLVWVGNVSSGPKRSSPRQVSADRGRDNSDSAQDKDSRRQRRKVK